MNASDANTLLTVEVKKVFPGAEEMGPAVLSGDGKKELGLLIIKERFEKETGKKILSPEERERMLALHALREAEPLSEDEVVDAALTYSDVRKESDRLAEVAKDLAGGYAE